MVNQSRRMSSLTGIALMLLDVLSGLDTIKICTAYKYKGEKMCIRDSVLRHIFHSDPLVSFENILKEETRKYKEKYQLSSGQLLSRFQLLDFSKEFQEIHQDGFHPSYINDAIRCV